MPVATQGTIKALGADDIAALGMKAILANSYHLYLRPGTETVKAAGGLHRFMDYEGFILTDSGGFQVLSLSDLRVIDDEGVRFRSHLDGSEHRLTPESVIGVQAPSAPMGGPSTSPPYPTDEAGPLAWIDSPSLLPPPRARQVECCSSHPPGQLLPACARGPPNT
jgi:hypothetical protein